MMAPHNRPLVAVRALLDLAKDPDDLPKVFKIIESLPGRSLERIHRRMRTDTTGRQLLAARPELGVRLSDRGALAELPAGTLGRTYFEVTERSQITAEGIVSASQVGRERLLPEGELRFAGERMRDSHDLWHVVTGYGTDVVGELALLAFTYAQAPHPGIGLIVGFAYLQRESSINEQIREAYRRGKRAAWLPAVAWERLLDQPLDAVRAELDLDAPPRYTPIPSAALRGRASLARRFWSRNYFGGAT